MALRENPRFCNNEVSGSKKKLENFWYYYKWWVICGVIATIFIATLISDIVNREKYDVSVILVSNGFVSVEQLAAADGLLDGFAPDRDGDGVSNVSITAVTGFRQDDTSNSYVSEMQFAAYLQSEENIVLIVDTFTKDYLESTGDLAAAFSGELTPLDGLFSGDAELAGLTGYWMIRRLTSDEENPYYAPSIAFADAVAAALG